MKGIMAEENVLNIRFIFKEFLKNPDYLEGAGCSCG